jgi:hypothetical protein
MKREAVTLRTVWTQPIAKSLPIAFEPALESAERSPEAAATDFSANSHLLLTTVLSTELILEQ